MFKFLSKLLQDQLTNSGSFDLLTDSDCYRQYPIMAYWKLPWGCNNVVEKSTKILHIIFSVNFFQYIYVLIFSGNELIPFSSSHVYPSTTVMSPPWAGVLNNARDARLHNQQQQLQLLDKEKLFLGSSPSTSSYIGGKQISFLQGGSTILHNQSTLEAPVCQPLLRTVALTESGGARSKIYGDRLTTQVHESDCALSLLSSPQSQTSGLALSRIVHPNSVSLEQPLGPSVHGHSLEPMDSVLISSGSDPNVHCQGMFHMGLGESQANETPQTLPFHWE